jgi:hypothetical protein
VKVEPRTIYGTARAVAAALDASGEKRCNRSSEGVTSAAGVAAEGQVVSIGERPALTTRAGIFRGDPRSLLAVSAQGVLGRDRVVLEQLTSRGIPWVMVLNGTYTPASHRLVANAVRYVCEGWREAGATDTGPRPGGCHARSGDDQLR